MIAKELKIKSGSEGSDGKAEQGQLSRELVMTIGDTGACRGTPDTWGDETVIQMKIEREENYTVVNGRSCYGSTGGFFPLFLLRFLHKQCRMIKSMLFYGLGGCLFFRE